MQDCVCLVVPYPFRSEPFDEFNVTRNFDIMGAGDVWYARQQLFFKCTLCPTGAKDDPSQYKEFSLVFFSTCEPISLTPDSCMQRKGVPMLYERSATVLPSLYVCPVQNVLGSVPLIPCYLNGNASNHTIQYRYRGAIPAEAAADSRPDNGTGSRLFEINIWMWRYGRTFPLHHGSSANTGPSPGRGRSALINALINPQTTGTGGPVPAHGAVPGLGADAAHGRSCSRNG